MKTPVPAASPRLNIAEWKDLIFLTGLAAAALLWNLGAGSLASWDEANYAVVSKLVVETGDWIVFRWPGGGFFFDKPPLYFWLTAIGYKIFGIGELATRLPSALGGIGLVGLTYLLGRRFFGSAAGLASAGILLTATDFIRYARFGTMDVLQLFFFAALILAYLGTDSKATRWYWFWLASAGCFMTKGPLVFLAWGIAGIHFVAEGRWKTLAVPQFWLGLGLFAGLTVPWHVAAFKAQPEGFWREYVIKNYITRGAAALDGHEGNAFFYLRILINKYQPWIYLLPLTLAASLLRLWKGRDRSADILLLTWTAVIFGFFTFMVKTKLNWYILPIHPALSVLAGVCLAGWFKGKSAWIRLVILAAMLLHITAGSGSVFTADHAREIRQLGSVIQSRVPAYDPVYLYDHHEQPAALFYWDRPVLYADSMSALDQARKGKKRFWIAVPARVYESRMAEFTRRGLYIVARTEAHPNQLYFLEAR
jgi:4-amino-4-deoxy-L-arabinose transferase-like glycosyltransferase